MSPPVRRPDLLFFGFFVVGNAGIYSTFFRSYRKWQLFLVSCVFFVAFRTLFINLAPKNVGLYSTCPSQFLDFLLFFEVSIFVLLAIRIKLFLPDFDLHVHPNRWEREHPCPKPNDVHGLVRFRTESIHVQSLVTSMV